jgi:hypothetical protein
MPDELMTMLPRHIVVPRRDTCLAAHQAWQRMASEASLRGDRAEARRHTERAEFVRLRYLEGRT